MPTQQVKKFVYTQKILINSDDGILIFDKRKKRKFMTAKVSVVY